MFKCCYPNCGTKLTDQDVAFYAFPLEDEVNLKKWIAALGRRDFYPSKSDFLCSHHFPPDSIENGILKPNATPLGAREIKSDKLEDVTEFDICRICGKAKEMFMTDIFDDELDICEKMSLCLPIVVNANDSLPQTICDECFEQLNIAATLVQKCLATEAKLLPLFNSEDGRKTRKPLPLNGPIICDKCEVYFSDMALFDEHMVEHEEAAKPKTEIDGQPFIVCSSCGHVFSDWTAYEEHKAFISYPCKLCEEPFRNKCLCFMHKCQKFKCQHCGAVVKSDLQLKRHMMQVHSRKKMLRKVEKIEIESDPTMEVDVKPVIGKKGVRTPRKELYHCNICDIKFNANKKLRDHCIEYHGTPNVLWICKFCGKSMTTKVSLQIHERIHFDSKPYICEWCGNGYRSRANLNQHQVIHTGVRNHECPKCGKRFSRKAFVRTHMRVHTGERPYVCDICGHRFTQLGDMKRHRNRHQNPNIPAYPSDRVYACDFCGEHFTQLSMLKKHRLLHASQNIAIIDECETESKELAIDLENTDDDMDVKKPNGNR